MDSALAWLLAWTANNIGVTLLNKAAFSKVDFPYPFFLSFVHMCCNSVGAAMVFRRMDSERAKAKDSDEGAGGGERGGGGAATEAEAVQLRPSWAESTDATWTGTGDGRSAPSRWCSASTSP